MTEVEEAVGRLTRISDPQYDGAWAAPHIPADIRTLLSALSEMQADKSGKGGRVVSEEVVERAITAFLANAHARKDQFSQRLANRALYRDEWREAMRAALATLPPAPEEVAGLIAAAKALLERWDMFISHDGWGNQADAYYSLAKGASEHWGALRTALEQATTAGVGRS